MFAADCEYEIRCTNGCRVLLKDANPSSFVSVADPDPGSGAFLTRDPGSAMGKKSGSGSGMNNPDYISESLETIYSF